MATSGLLSTTFASSSPPGLHQHQFEEPTSRGSDMGSHRDQLDRVNGGIKRRTKHFQNLQKRLEEAHAKIAELTASIAPLQRRLQLEASSIQNLRNQASLL